MDFVQDLVGRRVVMRRPVFGAGSCHEETQRASLASYEDFLGCQHWNEQLRFFKILEYAGRYRFPEILIEVRAAFLELALRKNVRRMFANIRAFRSTLLASGRPQRGLEHASEEYLSPPKKQKVKSTSLKSLGNSRFPKLPIQKFPFPCPKRGKRGEKGHGWSLGLAS
jgi:hypothetical protein